MVLRRLEVQASWRMICLAHTMVEECQTGGEKGSFQLQVAETTLCKRRGLGWVVLGQNKVVSMLLMV